MSVNEWARTFWPPKDTLQNLTLFGQICPPLSYFNTASKLNNSFALMHSDFELNLITRIFRKFGVSRITGSDVIFAFVSRGTYKEFHTVLNTMQAYHCAYSIHCTAYSLLMLIFGWNKIIYLLINALHLYNVIDDVIIQKYCFFCCFSK